MFSWLTRLWQKSSQDSDSSEEKTLYVGNLLYSVTRNELQDIFSEYGEVESARIIRDNKTRKSRGYGFVTFSHATSAQNALAIEGETVNGRPIRVRLAHSKPHGED